MQYEPHEYQSFATDYIENHPISALLIDMGLGKTVITILRQTRNKRRSNHLSRNRRKQKLHPS